MMSDEVNTLLLPYQLNYSLWQVMFVIREKSGCTSIEMAEHLNVSKPSIAKRIQALSALNVLTHIETEDKRQKKMILSATGEALFLQCSAIIDQFEHSLINKFDTVDIQQSVGILHAIIHELESAKSGEDHAK